MAAKAESKIKNIYDLTPMQEGMLFHSLMHNETGAYFEQSDITISGDLNIELLGKTLNLLLQRHDILRTVFLYKKVQKPRQVVLNERETSIYFEDLSGKSNSEQIIKEYTLNEQKQGFELSKDVLIKISVFKTNTSTFRLIWSFHHILMDGWCMGIILSEFFQIYNGLVKNTPVSLPPVYPFASYLKWLESRNYTETEAFWKNYLSVLEDFTGLPKRIQKSDKYLKNTLYWKLEGNKFSEFNKFCTTHGITVNNAFQTLWGLVLQLYNFTDDACMGSVVSGRPAEIPNVDSILGLFINTIPVRVKSSENETVLELMKKIQESQAECSKHDYFPLADIQKNSALGSHLFDHIIVFENYAKQETAFTSADAGFKVENIKHHEQTNYDLNIIVNPTAHSLDIHIDYNETVFEALIIQQAFQEFELLLNQIFGNSSLKVSEINWLSAEEQGHLNKLNDTNAIFEKRNSVIELIEQHKVSTETAIIFGDLTISYAELINEANRFANMLNQQYQVKKNDIVAIQANRSEKLIISILGILKTGAAYLPIDPNTPEERTQFVLKDANVKLFVTDKKCNFQQTFLLQNWEVLKVYSEEFISENVKSTDLAYIIYTSGSTGKPKGCKLTHANLLHYIQWANQYYFQGIEGNFPLYTSIAFDLTITSMFSTLSRGKKLSIFEQKEEVTTILKQLFASEFVDCIKITPAHIGILEHLAIRSDTVKIAIVGGEQLTLEQVSVLRKINPDIRIFNEYGPTEATVGCVVKEIKKEPQSIEIGKPISNMKAMVLGSNLKPVPIGVKGELYLAGNGIASGYLNRDELTKERFLTIPELGDSIWYKTGDIVYWNQNDDLVYINRIDNQLKLRGYRVEPGEIEQVILLENNIKEAVVLLVDEVLIAYYTTKDNLEIQDLKLSVSAKLPEYMVPQFFIHLEKIPLTTNGKIDKNALPKPSFSKEFMLPETATETKLAKIWQEILKVNQVGKNDNFFELGGHSLKLTILYSLIIKHFEKEISIKELFKTPVLSEQALLIDGGNVAEQNSLEKAPLQSYYPLSFAQKRLYLLKKIEENTTAYNIPVALQIEGDIAIEKIEAVLKQLVSRHEILRTSFVTVNGIPMQQIHEHLALDFKYSEDRSKIKQFIKPFNLEKTPLFRVVVVKEKPNRFLLGFDMHHIISDGFSSGIFIQEFTKLYNQQSLQPLSFQYKDFAFWQQQFAQSDKFKNQKNYWKKQFEQLPESFNLPYKNGKRPTEQSFEGDYLSFDLPSDLVNQIKNEAQKAGVSVFMYMLSGYSILLSKYAQQADIVIGTPVSGRTLAATKEMLGVFINTLAIRNNVNLAATCSQFLAETKNNVLSALDNQDFPFELLVEELKLSPDLSRNPLFDCMFVFQNQSDATLQLGDAKIEALEADNNTSKFDITTEVIEGDSTLKVSIEFATALFEKSFIAEFFAHYVQILKQIVEKPQLTIAEIHLLTPDEENELLSDKTGSLQYAFSNETIVSQFYEQVKNAPNITALIHQEVDYTFSQIDAKANQIANYLLKYGIEKDDTIAINLPRGLDFVVAMLGMMKSGAAYVPVDVNYPIERQKYIIEDSKAKYVIVSDNQLNLANAINLTDFNNASTENVNKATPDGLAYIIYTSGSTGKPKGVAIEHRNAVSFIEWCKKEFQKDSYEYVFAGTSFSFDLSIFELFYHFSVAKPIVLLESGLEIVEQLKNYKNVLLNTVPSVINDLLSLETNLSTISAINMAGEPIPQTVKNKLDFSRIKVRNLYGPSEDTTYSTCYLLNSKDSKQIIGKTIEGTKAYVLDKNKQLMPKGLIGELYLSGSNIARGYLHKPELTAERFIDNPFYAGERLYKTGDLVRWTSNWDLEYLGRADEQVKLRGFRIELGEIEAAISKYPSTESVCVLVKKEQLTAYFVSQSAIDTNELKAYLGTHLPSFMVPVFYVKLCKMPLTPNGKINKNSLPEPEIVENDSRLEEAVSPFEAELILIWKEILGIDKIALNDNFFSLGGHSLKVTQVVFQVKKKLNITISMKDFFRNPTVKQLATFLTNNNKTGVTIIKAEKKPYYHVSQQQKRLWLAEQVNTPSATFNMPDAYLIDGEIDIECLQKAVYALVQKHEILRTKFIEIEGEPLQEVLEESKISFYAEVLESEKWKGKVQNFVSEPFQLNQLPLFKVLLLSENKQKHVLVFSMHHIISDGWSMKIMMSDLMENYLELLKNNEIKSDSLSIQYKDYAEFQFKNTFQNDENYWLEQLKGGFEPINLPTDFKNISESQSNSAYTHIFTSAETLQALKEFALTNTTTLSNVVFSVFNILLNQLTSQKEITIGITSANRNYPETERLIGFFVNTLLVKTHINSDLSFEELLSQTIENINNAIEHQDYPVDLLMEKLKISKQPNVAYSFQSFNHIQLNEAKYDFLPFKVSNFEFEVENAASKYDLLLLVNEEENKLKLEFEYNAAVFKKETADKFLNYLNRFLTMVTQPVIQ
jgi:amino acid adenylation domain-containing protein